MLGAGATVPHAPGPRGSQTTSSLFSPQPAELRIPKNRSRTLALIMMGLVSSTARATSLSCVFNKL